MEETSLLQTIKNWKDWVVLASLKLGIMLLKLIRRDCQPIFFRNIFHFRREFPALSWTLRINRINKCQLTNEKYNHKGCTFLLKKHHFSVSSTVTSLRWQTNQFHQRSCPKKESSKQDNNPNARTPKQSVASPLAQARTAATCCKSFRTINTWRKS